VVLRWIALLFLCLPLCAAETAAALGEQVREISLDPDQCYRVRDLEFQREDIRLFFADGHLIFTKPVAGRRIMALFSGREPGDDAEILLRPPDRSERASLAAATGSPNLNDHFHTAVLIFTDGGAEELLKIIHEREFKVNSETGLLLAGNMNDMMRNMAASFQVRLVQDLLSGDLSRGLFYMALASRNFKNFDVMYDPTLPEQIIMGEVSSEKGTGFRVWASFQSRSRRKTQTPLEENVVLENYRIEATAQSDLTLSITARATARANGKAMGALGLELAPELNVTSAKVDGRPVEIYRRDQLRSNLIGGRVNDPFLIVLPEAFEAGSMHEVEFQYQGKVIKPAGNNVYFIAARTNWYPGRGYHFSTFDLTFRIPRELRVVATGDICEEKLEGDFRVTRNRTSAPVRLAGFNIGDYLISEATGGGVKVQVCANRTVEPALQGRQPQVVLMPPAWVGHARRPGEIVTLPGSPAPNPQARLNELAAEISSSLEWMTSRFGPPPLPALRVSPIPGNFGQGFPGLIYLSTIAFLSEKERPAALQTPVQHTFYSEVLYAHETAHQWWGNLVTAATYRDEWLQEALANYSALMVLERKKGARALETVLDEYRNELLANVGEPKARIETTGPITWGLRLQKRQGIDPWRVIIYNKGSWIMHMLRRRMGDPAFLAMLGEVRKRYAYKTLTTEQFRELAAEFSPKGLPDPDLENFFDNWVYSTGIPTLEFSSKVRGKAPAVEVAVSVRQTGVGDEFSVDVPVEIRIPGQTKPLVRWVRTGSEPANMLVKLKAAPTKVDLAPGNGVLAVRK